MLVNPIDRGGIGMAPSEAKRLTIPEATLYLASRGMVVARGEVSGFDGRKWIGERKPGWNNRKAIRERMRREQEEQAKRNAGSVRPNARPAQQITPSPQAKPPE